ncbi:MAG: stage IV sporulation protein A [Anaerofustis stercorihominis]|nr:stage IV sporulation protein A [Anaerofustis stercorihominis]
MADTSIYQDISARSGGDIYIGVVGAVRSGKSTFIKKFMELTVIPSIENKYKKQRAVDELPQSGSGKSIMTCEPKFVPNEAVNVSIEEGVSFNVRLIDCVGYVVEGAIGDKEDGKVRMVRTPWSENEIPFEKAAEIGTKKVISEHSTIGIVMTTDGSFTDIPRENYLPAEERVISELKELAKPFVIVLNTKNPYSADTKKMQEEMQEKYGYPVIVTDVAHMTLDDIENILGKVLYEFPVTKVEYKVPRWVAKLPEKHYIIEQINDFLSYLSLAGRQIRCVVDACRNNVCENFDINIDNIDLSCGVVYGSVNIDKSVFYKIIGEENNISIKNESDLFNLLTSLLEKKGSTEALLFAMGNASSSGYGIVYPTLENFTLSPPAMTNDSGRYGIKLTAKAQAMHIINSEIISEINPLIGQESECENFYNRLLEMYENEPSKLWETEIFGRSISDMFTDDIRNKLTSIPNETRQKLLRLIGKVSNSGKGGLVVFWI